MMKNLISILSLKMLPVITIVLTGNKLSNMTLYIQDWFLNDADIEGINQYKQNDKGRDEISLLRIFSIGGNLLPIFIAFGMSIILMDRTSFASINFIKIIQLINNGSLPLICYSILLSGMIFLLDKTDPDHESLKKKVLGVSILLLFLSISLYTLLTSLSKTIESAGHVFLFVLSMFLVFNAIKITSTMILLQHKVVADYAKSVKDVRKAVNKGPDGGNDTGIEF